MLLISKFKSPKRLSTYLLWVVLFNFPFGGFEGPLCSLPLICPEFIKWDAMHVINLGIALWTCGSAFRVLLDEYSCWEAGPDGQILGETDRLFVAYDRFREWCRRNRVEPCGSIHVSPSMKLQVLGADKTFPVL